MEGMRGRNERAKEGEKKSIWRGQKEKRKITKCLNVNYKRESKRRKKVKVRERDKRMQEKGMRQ